MDHDQAAAASQELRQILPLITDLDVSGLLRVKDEHVRFVELLFGGELHAAIGPGSALIEHGHPFL